MTDVFRYAKVVVFNVGLGVLFLMKQSMIEQTQTSFENKMYIFFP